jgi:hypothetical protein
VAKLFLGELVAQLRVDGGRFKRDMDTAIDKIEKASGAFTAIGAAAGAAAIGMTLFAKKAVDSAGDFQEQLNVLEVAFGKQAKATREWAKDFSSSMGLAEATIVDATGQFGLLIQPMTGSTEAASEMSKAFTQLALDLRSVTNVEIGEVFGALKSGITGEAEPLKRFGVAMTEAALNAFALSKGLALTTQKMSEGQKVLLRYAFILEQTAAKQGDFANTIDSFANASLILSEQIKDLTREFGEGLLPVATDIVNVFRKVIAFFRGLSDETKSLAAELTVVGIVASAAVAGFALFAAVLPSLISGFGVLLPALGAIAGVLGGLAPTLLAVGAGMAGLVLIIGASSMAYKAWSSDVSQVFAEVAEVISTFVNDVGAWFVDLTKPIVSAFKKVAQFLADAVSVWFDTFKLGIQSIINLIDSTPFGKSIADGLRKGIDAAAPQFEQLLEFMKKDFSVGGALKTSASAVGSAAAAVGKNIGKSVAETFEEGLRATGLLGLIEDIQTEFAALGKVSPEVADFSSQIGSAIERLKGMASATGKAAKAQKKIIQVADSIGAGALSGIRAGGFDASTFDIFQDIGRALSGIAGNIMNAFAGGGGVNVGAESALGGGLVSLLAESKIGQGVIGKVNEVMTTIVDAFGELLIPLVPFLDSILALAATFQPLVAAIMSTLLPRIAALFEGFNFVAKTLAGVVAAITDTWQRAVNFVVGKLSDLLDFAGFDESAAELRRFIRPVADGIGAAFMDAFNAADVDFLDSISNFRLGLDGATDSLAQFGEASQNLPAGFKLAAARQAAIDVDPADVAPMARAAANAEARDGAGTPSSAAVGAAARISQTFTGNNFNFFGINNLEELAEALSDVSQASQGTANVQVVHPDPVAP